MKVKKSRPKCRDFFCAYHSYICNVSLKNFCLFLLLFSLPAQLLKAQLQDYSVMFVDADSLYDGDNDKYGEDDYFLKQHPDWNRDKMQQKLRKMAKLIRIQKYPDLIGVSGIENRKILDYLLTNTELHGKGYSFVHRESASSDGLETAFLYRKESFSVLKASASPIVYPGKMENPVADILYVKGKFTGGQTLHILVNQWPKRDEQWNQVAAKTARRLVDSLYFAESDANIFLMGDFSQNPAQLVQSGFLQVKTDTVSPGGITSLMAWMDLNNNGTKFRNGTWELHHQFLAGSELLKGSSGLRIYPGRSKIIKSKLSLAQGNTPKKAKQKAKYFNSSYPIITYIKAIR